MGRLPTAALPLRNEEASWAGIELHHITCAKGATADFETNRILPSMISRA